MKSIVPFNQKNRNDLKFLEKPTSETLKENRIGKQKNVKKSLEARKPMGLSKID